VDPADQITANAAMESQGLATAIADNLQEAGFRGASAQPAEAAITTVTVTEIPPPVPVKTPVLMGQTKVMGCPAMGDDDQDTFATQFGAAVATELAVDPNDVVITSTRFGDDDGLYIQYIVKNVDDSDAKRVEMLLEYPSTAENVGEALSHGPCPKAAVQPAVRPTPHRQAPRCSLPIAPRRPPAAALTSCFLLHLPPSLVIRWPA
jgi:hypothetical protein